MGMGGTGRSVHDGVIKIEKDPRRLSSDPIKFERRQHPPLNTNHMEGGKLLVKDEPVPP